MFVTIVSSGQCGKRMRRPSRTSAMPTPATTARGICGDVSARLIGLSSLVTLACGGAATSTSPTKTTVDDGSKAPPTFVVGTGKDAYTATEDGATVEIIHGPQGGYHLWGAFRVKGISRGIASVTYDVARDGSPVTPLSSTTYEVDPFPRAGGREWAGLIGYVPNDQLALTANTPVVLSMTLTDASGTVLHDERHVVAGPVPP
jgi:hypothetical protein